MFKYQIVQCLAGEFKTTVVDDIAAWASEAGVAITGTNNNHRNRAELQGQPILSGFNGPMWNGNNTIRYEDAATYKVMST